MRRGTAGNKRGAITRRVSNTKKNGGSRKREKLFFRETERACTGHVGGCCAGEKPGTQLGYLISGYYFCHSRLVLRQQCSSSRHTKKKNVRGRWSSVLSAPTSDVPLLYAGVQHHILRPEKLPCCLRRFCPLLLFFLFQAITTTRVYLDAQKWHRQAVCVEQQVFQRTHT